jgi:RNA polymerase sigma-70 factor, ECF subfamily
MARWRDVSPADEGRLLDAFLAAARNGEVAVQKRLLVDNAELMTDGGGRKPSALNILRGSNRIARFLIGIHRKFHNAVTIATTATKVNGDAGMVTHVKDGSIDTISIKTQNRKIVDGRASRSRAGTHKSRGQLIG